MPGRNLARDRAENNLIFGTYSVGANTDGKPCVFLSHNKENENIAEALGNYITSRFGYNIYLDKYDPILQEAVSEENDEKIVESIKAGLKVSTALICVVSDVTRLSWWVPYEVGIADDKNKSIASIKTTDVSDFPSFLKTQRTISSTSGLVQFLKSIGKFGEIFEETDRFERYASEAYRSGLIKYFG